MLFLIKMVVKLQGVYSLLTLVKMAANHTIASILMKTSAKTKANTWLLIKNIYFPKQKLNPSYT